MHLLALYATSTAVPGKMFRCLDGYNFITLLMSSFEHLFLNFLMRTLVYFHFLLKTHATYHQARTNILESLEN